MTILAGTYELFCAIYYIMHVFWYLSTNDACIYTFTLCLNIRWYVLNMWYMNFDVYIFYDLSWFFHNFFGVLCSVLCVSSESDPSRRDRSVSVPAESAAETETLNHARKSSLVPLESNGIGFKVLIVVLLIKFVKFVRPSLPWNWLLLLSFLLKHYCRIVLHPSFLF